MRHFVKFSNINPQDRSDVNNKLSITITIIANVYTFTKNLRMEKYT